ITGSETGILVTPAAASTLVVAGFPNTQAGVAQVFTVTARDAVGNTATAYTGTVKFTSSDPLASFAPLTYTFTTGSGADNGFHTFSSTLRTVGTQSITATDQGNASINGTQTGILVTPGAATALVVTGFPTPVLAGTSQSFTVTAKDQFGNIATGYTGTINLTSSDSQAIFTPSTYTFTTGDAGVHSFAGILKTSGTQSITATDSFSGFVGTQSGIVVNAATAASLTLSGFPNTTTAGVPHGFTLTARDI